MSKVIIDDAVKKEAKRYAIDVYNNEVFRKKTRKEMLSCAFIAGFLYSINQDNLCPLCKSETWMNEYEHHPDMKGPKPYDIVCRNIECSHTWMPSCVEHHINDFERAQAQKRITQIETALDELLKDKLITQYVYNKIKGQT